MSWVSWDLVFFLWCPLREVLLWAALWGAGSGQRGWTVFYGGSLNATDVNHSVAGGSGFPARLPVLVMLVLHNHLSHGVSCCPVWRHPPATNGIMLKHVWPLVEITISFSVLSVKRFSFTRGVRCVRTIIQLVKYYIIVVLYYSPVCCAEYCIIFGLFPWQQYLKGSSEGGTFWPEQTRCSSVTVWLHIYSYF